MAGSDGRVAVITGAASGIGYALAERAATERMSVVLVDVDEPALEDARAALAARGASAHARAVDVSDRDAMADLGAWVAAEVGDVWLLVNNAGVFLAGPLLEMPIAQWRFMIDVNLWGVVHGLHAFLPGMVERDAGHIVNTSSVDGIVTAPDSSAYIAAKHGVTALTETLYRELERAGSAVGVSVLCPGAVATNIVGSARHWPGRLGEAPAVPADTTYPELDGLMRPAEVAEITFAAIAARRFWILTHADQYAAAMRARVEGALSGANPNDESVDPNWRSDLGRRPS